MDSCIDTKQLENLEVEEDKELQEILEKLYDAYDALIIYLVKKETGSSIEFVDDEHVQVDSVLMDNDEFADWLEEHYPLCLGQIDGKTKCYQA